MGTPNSLDDPYGEVIAGHAYNEETVLFADIDTDVVRESRFDLDVVGHFSCPDVSELRVDRTPREPVTFTQFSSLDSAIDPEHTSCPALASLLV